MSEFFKVNIPKESDFFLGGVSRTSKPFFNFVTENGTIKRFMDAVANDPEEAWYFISKGCAGDIDLDALREFLSACEYKYLTKPQVIQKNKSVSLLVFNRERGEKSILHMKMIREPDQFGLWKIFSIEKE